MAPRQEAAAATGRTAPGRAEAVDKTRNGDLGMNPHWVRWTHHYDIMILTPHLKWGKTETQNPLLVRSLFGLKTMRIPGYRVSSACLRGSFPNLSDG